MMAIKLKFWKRDQRFLKATHEVLEYFSSMVSEYSLVTISGSCQEECGSGVLYAEMSDTL